MHYSKSTGGFYVTEIHGNQVPDDCVSITNEYHAELLAGQSNGMFIVADEEGYPRLAHPPEPTLEQVKELKWVEIKKERDAREAGGFNYKGAIFDSDSKSVERITSAVLAAQAAKSAGSKLQVEWTVADNSRMTLTTDDLLAIPLAMAQFASALHATARELHDSIFAATTAEAVGAIEWPEE